MAGACPLPQTYPHIVMAHGGGGRLAQQLLDGLIRPALAPQPASAAHDSAVLAMAGGRLAFTTDSYVVNPVFFPGGDIGKLAVCGTLNDLAMSGAKPLCLSCALILEEGFALADLERILRSMRAAASQAEALIVTGDTKVVERGKGDGIYINTAGIGVVADGIDPSPQAIAVGDGIVISGDIGRHGMAVMLARAGLGFDFAFASDCADLSGLVQDLLAAGLRPHCLRDLTRGGLAGALVELAQSSRHELLIDEGLLPVDAEVEAACDILGIDPLYVANEGCMALIVPEPAIAATLAALRQHPCGQKARHIGQVAGRHQTGLLVLQTRLGTRRVVDLLSGEQLPRIC